MDSYYNAEETAVDKYVPFRTQFSDNMKEFMKFLDDSALAAGRGKGESAFMKLIRQSQITSEEKDEKYKKSFEEFKNRYKELFNSYNAIRNNKERYEYIEFMQNNAVVLEMVNKWSKDTDFKN